MSRGKICMTKRRLLPTLLLFTFSNAAWAIYGPSLMRADRPTAVRACKEAQFREGIAIAKLVENGDANEIVGVLGSALREWRATSPNSVLYPARTFCIHELVPDRLPDQDSSPQEHAPNKLIKQFKALGISYFYYGPDDAWTLQRNPVDLMTFAFGHQASRWGREAFLMMTKLGW